MDTIMDLFNLFMKKEGYRISDLSKFEEDFLCSPYHGWSHDGEAVVEIKYAGAVIFAVLLVMGVPFWLALGLGGAFWALVGVELPIESIPQQFFSSTDSWLLLAIPYYLLAGNLMAYLGSAQNRLKVITDLVGHLRGGLPAAAVISCAIFGALSGSSIATCIAVGSLVIPQMTQLGYSKQNSLGIVASAGH